MAEKVELQGQRQVSKVNPNTGVLAEVIEVTFTVDGQGPFTVDVEKDAYDADTVRAAVDNVVERVRATRQLFG